MRNVEILHEPVELYKILKFENFATSGGEAKFFIEQGEVSVNGQVETRKRRKMLVGDVISIQGESVRLVLASA